MTAVAALSFALALVLFATYYFQYRLGRHRFCLFMSVAWCSQAFYFVAEGLPADTRAEALWHVVAYLTSLPSSFSFFLAYQQLRHGKPRAWSVAAWSIAILAGPLAVLLGEPSSLMNLPLAYLPGTVFAAASLVLLSSAILQLSDSEMLSLLIPTADSIPAAQELALLFTEQKSPPEFKSQIQRLSQAARWSLGISLLSYGTIQVTYVWAFFPRTQGIALAGFTTALVAKTAHAFGAYTLLLARVSFAEAMLRKKSVTEDLGALAATVEHDLRNPLGILRREVAILATELTPHGVQQRRVNFIAQQIDRIASAVDVIPAMRESKEYYGERSRVWDVADITKAAIASLKSGDLDFAIPIDLEAASGNLYVVAYRERLIQAVHNVLVNALEAATTVREIRSPRVVVRCRRGGATTAVVSILDNGPGISRAAIDLVCRPMFTTKPRANSGLGLFVASRVVEQHRGTIKILSDGQLFTEVSIELPLVDGV